MLRLRLPGRAQLDGGDRSATFLQRLAQSGQAVDSRRASGVSQYRWAGATPRNLAGRISLAAIGVAMSAGTSLRRTIALNASTIGAFGDAVAAPRSGQFADEIFPQRAHQRLAADASVAVEVGELARLRGDVEAEGGEAASVALAPFHQRTDGDFEVAGLVALRLERAHCPHDGGHFRRQPGAPEIVLEKPKRLIAAVGAGGNVRRAIVPRAASYSSATGISTSLQLAGGR